MSNSNADDGLPYLAGPGATAYYAALGSFIDIFAMAENNIQLTLWRVARLPPHIAQALLSNVRIEAAGSQLKRLAQAFGWSKARQNRLATLVAQLGEITQLRNDILHFGAIHRGNGIHEVTNILYVNSAGRIRTSKVSADILDAMSIDLLAIIAELTVMRSGRKTPAYIRKAAQIPPEHAWRYKPDTQQGLPRRPRQKRPRRQDPPQSSLG